MAVYQLNEECSFPDPHYGEPDGLLAVGGDLTIDRLILAYSNGIFPWPNEEDMLMWFCPLKRFVIFPDEVHISHSMRTFLNKTSYKISFNRAFEEVIYNCSEMRKGETWIFDNIKSAYIELHNQGFAVSVEVWDDEQLVGGLYGVNLGKSFFGESMFSKVPNASKLALIGLAEFMEENGGIIIDCQMETPHLKSMGGRYIDYDEYISLIRE